MKKIDSMRELIKYCLWMDHEGNLMVGFRDGYCFQHKLSKRLLKRVTELLEV